MENITSGKKNLTIIKLPPAAGKTVILFCKLLKNIMDGTKTVLILNSKFMLYSFKKTLSDIGHSIQTNSTIICLTIKDAIKATNLD